MVTSLAGSIPRIFRSARHVAFLALLAVVLAALPAPAGAALRRVDIAVGRPVGDGPKTPAQMRIGGARGYRGAVGIELRGSASRRSAKQSYALETRSRGRRSRSVALLGMPKENDWVLNAVHSDPTFSRDVLAYATARRLGRWAPRTRLVELYLDRRYQGVYVLSEQAKLDRARVAVPRAGITGGYLVELSSEPFAGGFTGPVTGRAYGHKDPDHDDLKPAEAAWIAAYVADAERAVAARDGGWRAFVDESAAVDYLLLQELFANQDAFRRSTFLAKGTDQPLVFGPVWDFDRSMGLSLSGAFAIGPRGWVTPGRPWAGDLLADVTFRHLLAARWSALRRQGLLEDMLHQVDGNRRALRAAQVRNARRWPATRARPHAVEMRRLRGWLVRRVRWIDANVQALARAAPANPGQSR